MGACEPAAEWLEVTPQVNGGASSSASARACATMAADEADFRRYAAAVTAFYATLTPSQQLTFDRETLPQGGAGR